MYALWIIASKPILHSSLYRVKSLKIVPFLLRTGFVKCMIIVFFFPDIQYQFYFHKQRLHHNQLSCTPFIILLCIWRLIVFSRSTNNWVTFIHIWQDFNLISPSYTERFYAIRCSRQHLSRIQYKRFTAVRPIFSAHISSPIFLSESCLLHFCQILSLIFFGFSFKILERLYPFSFCYARKCICFSDFDIPNNSLFPLT